MDAIFLYKPEQEGEPGQLETRFKASDKIEKNILTNITGLAMSSQIAPLLFPDQKEASQEFLHKIFDLTQNLFNANLHRKNHAIKEIQELKRFRRECIQNQNKHLDLYENPNELWIELNGFLTSLKSSLDSLALSLEPVLNVKLGGWNKVKDKQDDKLKSGQNVVNILRRNTPKEKSHIINPIIKMIEREIPWITYLVDLRDSPVHHGGLKNVSKLKFEQESKSAIGQIITHKDGSKELVEVFIKRAMETMIEFAGNLIMAVMHTKVTGYIIAKIVHGNGEVDYKWVPEAEVNEFKRQRLMQNGF